MRIHPFVIVATLALLLFASAGAALLSATRGTATVFFDDHGALGDGVTNDQPAMQDAIDAGAGGVVSGTNGKRYTLRGQLYVPSNTTIDCRGAVIQFDSSITTYINAMINVGTRGEGVLGNEHAGHHVTIKNCVFESALGRNGSTAIKFRPGSSNVDIVHNTLRNTAGYGMTAVNFSVKGLRDINISHNEAEDIKGLVLLRAAERQVASMCYKFLTPTTAGSCDDIPVNPRGAKKWQLPPDMRERIASGFGFGVEVINPKRLHQRYGQFGESQNGDDFTYDSETGTITFASPLPDQNSVVVNVFAWDPRIGPARDLVGLRITHNRGFRFRDSAIQLSCPVFAMHNATPGDCPHDVVIDSNTLTQTYEPDGMISNFGGFTMNRANLLLYSRDFSNAAWIKNGISLTYGQQAPASDGRPIAWRLMEDTSNVPHSITTTASDGVIQGETYTFSCHMKAAGTSLVRMSLTASSGAGAYIEIDLSTGTIVHKGSVGGGILTASGVIPAGDGWHRPWLVVPVNTARAHPTINILKTSGTHTYAGDGTSGIDAFECQLEQGAVPSFPKGTNGAIAPSLNSNLISINGIQDFEVTGNILGPGADQGIHLEDQAGNGVVANNIIRDVDTYGITLQAVRNVTVANNTIINPYRNCILVGYRDPAHRSILHAVPFAQSHYLTLRHNTCDGAHNPSITAAYSIGAARAPFTLKFDGNEAVNLPDAALHTEWANGALEKMDSSF